jgi:hypothetical protein
MQRFTKPTQTMGTAFAVPHAFIPMPGMTPLEIARGKGAEAKSLGHLISENPHTLVPNEDQLSAEWVKGYNGG